jgi:hypothetical protein
MAATVRRSKLPEIMTLLPRSGRPLNNEVGTLFPAWNGPSYGFLLVPSMEQGTSPGYWKKQRRNSGLYLDMPRKLKTYQTSQGFYDLAIAAPSMKAALEAWRASSNLFHQGFEEGR